MCDVIRLIDLLVAHVATPISPALRHRDRLEFSYAQLSNPQRWTERLFRFDQIVVVCVCLFLVLTGDRF